jgi:hypothetical protein
MTFFKAKVMGAPTGLPIGKFESLDDVETTRLVSTVSQSNGFR